VENVTTPERGTFRALARQLNGIGNLTDSATHWGAHSTWHRQKIIAGNF
jgi:hypothetical protein